MKIAGVEKLQCRWRLTPMDLLALGVRQAFSVYLEANATATSAGSSGG
jgi:hypothetical protein